MEGQEFQNTFSVDLEDWYQGIEIDMQDWGDYAPRIRKGLDPLLDLLDEANTKSTFFVLGYQAEQTPDIIRQISDAGHEIASHGYSHRFVYNQTPTQFRAELKNSKSLLEDISGQEVNGYRAPFFSITSESLWALDILLDEGFLYDSSLFPVRNYRYGIANATRKPGWFATPDNNRIYEIPLSTIPLPSILSSLESNVPMSGGGYFRLYPYALTRFLVNRLSKENLGLVFYMHPWEYDANHPKIKFPRRFPQFTHYLNLKSTHQKTRKLLSEFEFTTIEDAYSRYFREEPHLLS